MELIEQRKLIQRKLDKLSLGNSPKRKKSSGIAGENEDEAMVAAQISRIIRGPRIFINILTIVSSVLGILTSICLLIQRCLDLSFLFLLMFFTLASLPPAFFMAKKRFPDHVITITYFLLAVFYTGGISLIAITIAESAEALLCGYQVCHSGYGSTWIKDNYRESSELCQESNGSKANLLKRIQEMLTEFQKSDEVTHYDLSSVVLMNFTTFFIVFSALILTNLAQVIYLSIYFLEALKLKKKYKQLFKRLCKEEEEQEQQEQDTLMATERVAAASQEMTDSLNI